MPEVGHEARGYLLINRRVFTVAFLKGREHCRSFRTGWVSCVLHSARFMKSMLDICSASSLSLSVQWVWTALLTSLFHVSLSEVQSRSYDGVGRLYL